MNGFENTFGSGVLITGSDNLIEHNNFNRNVIGVDVIATGNVICGNTVSGSSVNNWNVVAGNVCQVISATTSGAIIGDSGGTFSGTSSPNANFTY